MEKVALIAAESRNTQLFFVRQIYEVSQVD
jgi:hypothetical protein